jgi:hypothetical protein
MIEMDGEEPTAFEVQRFSDDNVSSRLRPLDYSEMLERRGRLVSGRPDVGLDRSSVLLALAALRVHAIAVRRCEIVQTHFHSPDILTSVHHVDRTVGELKERYSRRSQLEVEEFIRRFSDPDDGTVLYILTLDQAAPAPEARAA